MLADLRARLPLDPARVYASGFSNGGEFTARLAVERSGVFAAAGFSAGGLQQVHVPDRPIPMALTLGTLDDRVLRRPAERVAARSRGDPRHAGDRGDARHAAAVARADQGADGRAGVRARDAAALVRRRRTPVHGARGADPPIPERRNNPAGFVPPRTSRASSRRTRCRSARACRAGRPGTRARPRSRSRRSPPRRRRRPRRRGRAGAAGPRGRRGTGGSRRGRARRRARAPPPARRPRATATARFSATTGVGASASS